MSDRAEDGIQSRFRLSVSFEGRCLSKALLLNPANDGLAVVTQALIAAQR